MYKGIWKNLRKVNDIYELEPDAIRKTQCFSRVNFIHVAFHCNEEYLIATDTAGFLYCIDLSDGNPSYQKLVNVGKTTFIAFNPIHKFEVLVGLATGDIKVLRIDDNTWQSSLLIAHTFPPLHLSFYKKYCLTCSRKEVVIWCLHSCTKLRRLSINATNAVPKKASFSNLGHIVILYRNDIVQAWNFNRLENDVKIDTNAYGIRNIKDFVFTQNGRAMIIVTLQKKVIILNTANWNLIKSFNLPESFNGVKELSVVPSPLDGGANNIIACLTSNSKLYFLDVNQSCIVDTLHPFRPIRKIAVSPTGRYLAYIEKEGRLKFTTTEKLFTEKSEPLERLKEPCRPVAHKAQDHLKCVGKMMKQELRLERLLLILKEFGEYPEEYRRLIWSTIFELPANRSAYNNLANQAVNTEFTIQLLENYPLADRSKKTLLITTINCLIQWCPLLVQCTFLPNFIFPFLMIFQKDLVLGFEFVLTLLLNYCEKWFEYHPLPSLNVLGIIENILLHTCPSLLNVFCERGITTSEYAWPLLKTAMSEVLCTSEWLILWDHLISFKKPSLFLIVVVAYSICSRELIVSSLHTKESIERYFTTQGHVSARELIKLAQQLNNDIPLNIHPNYYLGDQINKLPSKGPYTSLTLHDFPRFLTDNISIHQLEKLKEEERIVREHNLRAIEIAEKNRLKHERKVFMEQIHRMRLTEAEKCTRQQLSDVTRNLMKHRLKRAQTTRVDACLCAHLDDIPYLNLDSADDEHQKYWKNGQVAHYEQLQQDVDKLEDQVQSLLNSLRSQ